jgi:hypothetical protein
VPVKKGGTTRFIPRPFIFARRWKGGDFLVIGITKEEQK